MINCVLESAKKCVENERTIHHKTPVSTKIKQYVSRDELVHRQVEAMKKIYEEKKLNHFQIVPYEGPKTTPRKAHEGLARAKCNFLAHTLLELSLAKGELVTITRKVDDNWFEGKIDGREGIFPVAYVEILYYDLSDPPSPSTKPAASLAAHSLLLNESEQVKDSMGYDEPADFETAIVAAQWGKFNLILYILSITSGWTSVFETTTMSYVFPAAGCDLKLNLQHKGLLNAVTYTGMISTGFVWGYLCDTLGRKKLLVVGYLLDGMFVLLSAMSQNFTMLMIAKFFGGFIINGPYSAITTYLSELHCARHRSRVQMILGTIFTAASLVLPLLAIQVLPLNFKVVLGENFVFHSWNLYLFICAIIPLISGVAFIFLPESPKFLMTTGQNEKALQVFRKIYRINTGKPENTYPIKVLINEIELNGGKNGKITANRTKAEALVEGWSQMKPLFRPPHLTKILFVCLIQVFAMNSLNTLRLWLPQLFQAINDYQFTHKETASLCKMIAVFRPSNKTINLSEDCIVNSNNYSVYTNSMIIATVAIFGYVLAGGLINTLGKKRLYISLGLVCAITAMSLYFSRSMITTLTLASLFIMAGSIMVNTMLAVIVDLFPTTLRTMTVSIAMMSGRSGAVLGNIIYPNLLASGCAPPFLYIALSSFSCALFGLLLPNTDMKALV